MFVDIIELKKLAKAGRLTFYSKNAKIFVKDNQTEEVVCLADSKEDEEKSEWIPGAFVIMLVDINTSENRYFKCLSKGMIYTTDDITKARKLKDKGVMIEECAVIKELINNNENKGYRFKGIMQLT